MRTPTTAAALLVLCGCATETATRVYAPPSDLTGYARIAIRNASPKPLYATLWDDALTCSAPKVGLPGNGPFTQGQTVAIHARKGEPLTIFAIYFYPRAKCYPITTFVPTADSYVVTFDAVGDASDTKTCTAAWAEGDEASARPVPKERVAARDFKVAFGQNGPWCKALSEAQRRALGVAAAPADSPAAPGAPSPSR